MHENQRNLAGLFLFFAPAYLATATWEKFAKQKLVWPIIMRKEKGDLRLLSHCC